MPILGLCIDARARVHDHVDFYANNHATPNTHTCTRAHTRAHDVVVLPQRTSDDSQEVFS